MSHVHRTLCKIKKIPWFLITESFWSILVETGPSVRAIQFITVHLLHCYVEPECLHANCVYCGADSLLLDLYSYFSERYKLNFERIIFILKKNRINWSNVKEYYFLVHLYQRIRIYLALLTMTMVTCTKSWPKTTQTFFRESNGEHPTVFYETEFCHVTLLRIIYGAVELICE